MTENVEKETLIAELVSELTNYNLAIFAGAGLSVGAGFVDWAGLMAPIATELGLDIEKEKSDLISLAQYHFNENNSRHLINRLLIEQFTSEAGATQNHKILSRLPINTYWTTNYDNMIEKTLRESGQIVDVKFKTKQLANTKPKRDAVVYKMHGDADHPDEAVLTKEDYESYHVKMQPFISALSGDLTSQTFLFLGFSFADPNLDYILSRIRINFSTTQRRHHCILKRVSQDMCEDQADFEYRTKKQSYFITDLKRFGIKCLLIDEYAEITDILREVERRIRRKTVLISGAAHDFTPYKQDEATKFIYELSKRLVEEGYNIVSGFGLGVGSPVISGALETIYMDPTNGVKDRLLLRPFPQPSTPSDNFKDLWTRYRHDMTSYAGVAIFIFGNKINEKGDLVNSNGMREEFDIAVEKGLFVIPIGATESMSRELWNEVTETYINGAHPEYQKNKDAFSELGVENQSLDVLLQRTIEIVRNVSI